MNIKEIFKVLEEKKETENKLQELTSQYENNLKNYLIEYFNGEIPKHLPINKNQFISVYSKSFNLYKGETGKISWTAKGSLVSVKDGVVTNGYSEKTLFQGEYEALPLNLRHNNVENAKQLTKPIFPLISKHYNGSDFGAPAYKLAENEDLGIILVWRKAGVSYIDRMSLSSSTESGLELLTKKNSHRVANKIKEFLNKPSLDEKLKTTLEKLTQFGSTHINVTIGGKLNEKIILEYTNFIEDLFGVGTTDNIVNNIKSQKDKLKNLKTQEVQYQIEEKKVIKESISEEITINGSAFKI